MINDFYFDIKVLYGFMTKGLMWVRLWNDWGIHVKDIRQCGLLFSERTGHTKYIKIGCLIIKILKPFNQ